ncbi:hypothetical protein CDAR_577261 [Caerostris darwini]|uniref:Uncharacterized protein n=1 Tax=Caerostris darwini TaxID=1538125 RepID=A0AAV4SP79_9ARAC|nr:hypothetical protein CDAR_577261 [Caerostris darwini]
MDAGLVTAKTLKASAATVKKAEEDVITAEDQFFQDRSSRLPPRQIITIANAQERNRHHKEQFPLLLCYYLMHCIYLFI